MGRARVPSRAGREKGTLQDTTAPNTLLRQWRPACDTCVALPLGVAVASAILILQTKPSRASCHYPVPDSEAVDALARTLGQEEQASCSGCCSDLLIQTSLRVLLVLCVCCAALCLPGNSSIASGEKSESELDEKILPYCDISKKEKKSLGEMEQEFLLALQVSQILTQPRIVGVKDGMRSMKE